MHLPPEITDRILDFLHTDRIALENCSLVCRSWVSCCRFHTIHRLSLPPHRQQKFLPFSTHIGRYVRDLIIHNQYDQVTDAICSQLVNLDSLAIINCHIPELDLHKYQALWSIPSIKSLRIIVCHYETIPPDSDGRVGSSNIESLVFYHVSGAGSFISWACGLDLFPRVRTFHYCAEYPHVGSGDDMNWLKSLCETCGPNLVDVKFQNIPALCSDKLLVALGQLKSLQKLEISQYWDLYRDGNDAWPFDSIPTIIKAVKSPTFTCVIFELGLWDISCLDDPLSLNNVWKGVAIALANSESKVHMELDVSDFPEERERELFASLGSPRSQGFVELTYNRPYVKLF